VFEEDEKQRIVCFLSLQSGSLGISQSSIIIGQDKMK
jgi:hypothetical protein